MDTSRQPARVSEYVKIRFVLSTSPYLCTDKQLLFTNAMKIKFWTTSYIKMALLFFLTFIDMELI